MADLIGGLHHNVKDYACTHLFRSLDHGLCMINLWGLPMSCILLQPLKQFKNYNVINCHFYTVCPSLLICKQYVLISNDVCSQWESCNDGVAAASSDLVTGPPQAKKDYFESEGLNLRKWWGAPNGCILLMASVNIYLVVWHTGCFYFTTDYSPAKNWLKNCD